MSDFEYDKARVENMWSYLQGYVPEALKREEPLTIKELGEVLADAVLRLHEPHKQEGEVFDIFLNGMKIE